MPVNVGQRHIEETPPNLKCYAVDAAMILAEHTLKNCKNEKHFSPDYRDSITNPLIVAARNAYVKSYSANKIRVTTPEDWKKREALQIEAIENAREIPALINLARRLNHLRRGKTEYWIKLAIEARDLLIKWHNADKRRYN